MAVRDPLGRITTLDRCGCGSLDALVDGNGNRTRWDRDVEGRVTAETRADGTATHYTYETTTPRLKQVTDRKGQVATYSYFKDDAFKQKTYTNTQVATATVSATYDASYQRLATMVDGTGTTTYGYHPVATGQLGAGQLASVDGPLGNDTITYTYDELGRVASRSINSVAQSLTYDALGRVDGRDERAGCVRLHVRGEQRTAPDGDRIPTARRAPIATSATRATTGCRRFSIVARTARRSRGSTTRTTWWGTSRAGRGRWTPRRRRRISLATTPPTR